MGMREGWRQGQDPIATTEPKEELDGPDVPMNKLQPLGIGHKPYTF